MDEILAREIEGLRQLKTKALRARYEELFGEETGSWNQAQLYRRMAWRLQAQAHGGLSERAQRRAGELAEEAALGLRAARPFGRAEGAVGRAAAAARDERLPPIGAVLQRKYRGETIEVEVLARGFGYREQVYGSLSQVAQRITGTRWNGYAFFGLRKAGRSSLAAPWR